MASTFLRTALLAGLGLLVVPLASDAAPPRVSKPAAGRSKPKSTRSARVPKALPSAKRLARVNALLTALGEEEKDELPPTVDGLLPVRPVLDDGAQIRISRGEYFIGANNYVPSGRIYVYTDDFPAMEFGFPTQIGTVHVLDCAVHGRKEVANAEDETMEATLRVSVKEVGEATIPGVDGHVLHAFVAKNTHSIIRIGYVDNGAVSGDYLGWYGCSLTPMN